VRPFRAVEPGPRGRFAVIAPSCRPC